MPVGATLAGRDYDGSRIATARCFVSNTLIKTLPFCLNADGGVLTAIKLTLHVPDQSTSPGSVPLR